MSRALNPTRPFSIRLILARDARISSATRSAVTPERPGQSEPASELERLIADLSESGLLVFVFGAGVGWCTAHLTGVTTPVFHGPADRRWWHVELGDDTASWTMDVRVDEITGVRFVRGPYPFPSFPGREVLTVQFLGPGGDGAPLLRARPV